MTKRKSMQNSTENLLLLSKKKPKTYLTSKETCVQIELTENENGSFSKHFSPEIVLTWTGVSASCVTFGTKQEFCSYLRKNTIQPMKQILSNVTGLARPRELLAIMGASGAGKTTLLNILTKKNLGTLTVSGQVHVNHLPMTTKLSASIAAYIQQDCLFVGNLTVKEQLIFQARLTMGNTTYTEKLKRVNKIIQELELSKCQDTLIGIVGFVKGISGGEKLRLAVACEILTNPPLLFCDEPTSGLDSAMAQHVVTILHNLAKQGKTVVCTIHQPSSQTYALFDKVLFLAEGRVAYLGSRDDALKFFDNLHFKCPINYNPAEHLIRTLAVTEEDTEGKMQIISEICSSFEKSSGHTVLKEEIESILNNKEMELPEQIMKSCYKVPWIEQFTAVFWRSCISIYKEPVRIKLRLLLALVEGAIAGLAYYHQDLTQLSISNTNAAIYMLVVTITFGNIFIAVDIFSSELPIFFRERANRLYSVSVYFLSKTLADQLVFIVTPLLFTNTSYWLIGLHPNISNFFTASLIFILVANVASSYGYFASSISSSTPDAIAIACRYLLPLCVLGGLYMRNISVPWYLRWIQYMSWIAYGFESLLINQWTDVNYIQCSVNNITCPKNGLEILQEYNIQPTEFLPNIVALIALMTCFRFAAYIALRLQSSKLL